MWTCYPADSTDFIVLRGTSDPKPPTYKIKNLYLVLSFNLSYLRHCLVYYVIRYLKNKPKPKMRHLTGNRLILAKVLLSVRSIQSGGHVIKVWTCFIVIKREKSREEGLEVLNYGDLVPGENRNFRPEAAPTGSCHPPSAKLEGYTKTMYKAVCR